MLTWLAISRYAFLRLGSSSANGTSMASRTRVGLRVSTVLFTAYSLKIFCCGQIPGAKQARSSVGESPTAHLHRAGQTRQMSHPIWRCSRIVSGEPDKIG